MTPRLVLLLALLAAAGLGCNGTLLIFGVEPTGDDDDATGDDDDSTPPGDDDDTTPPGDDDDTTPPGDDDDDSVPSTCAPDWPLDCGQGAVDSYNNGGDGSTDALLTYACFDGAEWTGPEYTYSFVVEESGEHTVRLTGFEGDLDLFVLGAPDGVCAGENCTGISGNPPGQDEALTFLGQAGRTVYIVVDGWGDTVSDYSLRLECPGAGGDDDDDDSTPPPEACTSLLVKARQASSVHVFTWDGGGYTGPTTQDPPGNGTVWSAVAGDFDGNGAMDFITARQSQGGQQAQLFAGACGSDQFTVTNVSQDNRGFTFSGLQDLHGVGDVDQDGDLDVVGITWSDGGGRVWLNGGDGLTWTAVGAAFDLPSWDPANDNLRESAGFPLVDMTGDALPDLLECSNQAQSPTSCTIHAGSGSGTFTAGAAFSVQRLANSMVAGDFNGDGAVDFLGGLDDDGDAGQVWLWAGSAMGPSVLPSGAGTPAFDVQADPSGGNDQDQPGYGWMFPADVDDDGDLDVIVEVMDPFNSLNHALHLATNDGLGGFTVSPIGASTSAWPQGEELVQSPLGVPARP